MSSQAPAWWTGPAIGVGWIIALVVLIINLYLGFTGVYPKEVMLLIAAVCAVRL